jgi:hypothetical protein
MAFSIKVLDHVLLRVSDLDLRNDRFGIVPNAWREEPLGRTGANDDGRVFKWPQQADALCCRPGRRNGCWGMLATRS